RRASARRRCSSTSARGRRTSASAPRCRSCSRCGRADRRRGPTMRVLNGPKHEIQVMAFSPDGTKLAVGGSAPRVHVWDLETERADSVLGTGGPFVAVGFWRGHLVGVVNRRCDVRLCDLSSGLERTLSTGLLYITQAVVAPRQGTVIAAGGDREWRHGLW